MIRYASADGAARREMLGHHMLVFNAASWETHLLNPAAAVLLEFISEAPRGLDELAALLADLLAVDQRGGASEHARTTVEQLQALGLVVAEERP